MPLGLELMELVVLELSRLREPELLRWREQQEPLEELEPRG